MRTRAMPHVGDAVTIVFLAASVFGIIERVEDERRRLHVLTEDGEAMTFTLKRATGRFVAAGDESGARLVFGNVHGDD